MALLRILLTRSIGEERCSADPCINVVTCQRTAFR